MAVGMAFSTLCNTVSASGSMKDAQREMDKVLSDGSKRDSVSKLRGARGYDIISPLLSISEEYCKKIVRKFHEYLSRIITNYEVDAVDFDSDKKIISRIILKSRIGSAPDIALFCEAVSSDAKILKFSIQSGDYHDDETDVIEYSQFDVSSLPLVSPFPERMLPIKFTKLSWEYVLRIKDFIDSKQGSWLFQTGAQTVLMHCVCDYIYSLYTECGKNMYELNNYALEADDVCLKKLINEGVAFDIWLLAQLVSDMYDKLSVPDGILHFDPRLVGVSIEGFSGLLISYMLDKVKWYYLKLL